MSAKKDLRKKVHKNKQEMFKTGGGVANITALNNYEELIHNLIILSVDGLTARFDDDILDIYTQENNTQENIGNNDETIYIELGDDNEATQSELEVPKKKTKLDHQYNLDCIEVSPTSPSFLSLPRTSSKNNVKNEEDKYLPSTSSKGRTEEANKENTLNSVKLSPALGKKWNPNFLKKQTSKELNVKKKNFLTKLQAAEKISFLSESKNELIKLQETYTEKEFKHADLKILKAQQDLNNARLDGELKEVEKKITEEMLRKMTSSNIFPNFEGC